MADYRFERAVIRNGKIYHRQELTISGAQIETQLGFPGTGHENGLHRLINKWNRQGLLGLDNGGPVYVYSVPPVEGT
ncbi:hypothetical protein EVC30_070 [Rhizobium phage RHph_Y1_11]|nr:hypothetical protein EVC30_070 [Rhizobium phage RHph_Y1_11]